MIKNISDKYEKSHHNQKIQLSKTNYLNSWISTKINKIHLLKHVSEKISLLDKKVTQVKKVHESTLDWNKNHLSMLKSL